MRKGNKRDEGVNEVKLREGRGSGGEGRREGEMERGREEEEERRERRRAGGEEERE